MQMRWLTDEVSTALSTPFDTIRFVGGGFHDYKAMPGYLAEHGFPMYEYMHRLLAIPETQSQFDLYPPGGTAVFYPGGRVPEAGELLVQLGLADTLRRLDRLAGTTARRPGRLRGRRAGAGVVRCQDIGSTRHRAR